MVSQLLKVKVANKEGLSALEPALETLACPCKALVAANHKNTRRFGWIGNCWCRENKATANMLISERVAAIALLRTLKDS